MALSASAQVTLRQQSLFGLSADFLKIVDFAFGYEQVSGWGQAQLAALPRERYSSSSPEASGAEGLIMRDRSQH